MSTLTLIRHGQAMAFSRNSDRLSALGEQQARKLGEYWVRQKTAFDVVFTGSLKRQQRTAQIVGECCAGAGLPWPEVQVVEEFNEYDALGICGKLAPLLAQVSKEFRALHDAWHTNAQVPQRNPHFQSMFEVLTKEWAAGTLRADGVESWTSFRDRVRQGIRRVVEGAPSRRVAVFTSGGPIGLAVQQVLGAPELTALEVNWRVRNCSLTGFLFSEKRISLDTFNATPHLDDPALCTFR